MEKHVLAFLKYAVSIVALSGIGMVNWWDADKDSLQIGVVTSSERARDSKPSRPGSAGARPAGYVVTRNGREVAQLPSGTQEFTDTGLRASTSSGYSASMVDALGLRTLPWPPKDLTADATPGQITLAWEISTDSTGISGYLVNRDGRLVATLDLATRVWTDTSIKPYTTYVYTVEAIDGVGHRSWQAWVVARTGQLP